MFFLMGLKFDPFFVQFFFRIQFFLHQVCRSAGFLAMCDVWNSDALLAVFFFILQPIIISSSASLPLVTSFWQKEVCLMVFMFFKKWVERVFGNNPTIRYYYLYLVLSLDLCFIIFVILFCWVIISSSISVWQSIIYVQLFYLNLMPI